MIYFLILAMIIIFFISLAIEKDIFCPPCLLTISYLISSILILYRRTEWAYELNSNTVEIIVFGTILFFIVFMITRYVFMNRKNKDNSNSEKKYITIDKKILNILLMINVIILISYTFFFLKSMQSLKFSGFSDMMHYYRLNTAYGDELDGAIPDIIMQLKKVNWATAYISLYIIIHNWIIAEIKGQRKKMEIKYIILILLYLPLTILSGGRFDLIVFCISAIVLWMILEKKLTGETLNIKKILKIFCVAVLILLIFSASRNLVGRSNDSNFLEYISMYFGAPIINFNEYLEVGNHKEYQTFGREIFKSIYRIVEKVGNIKLEELTKTFVVLNGNNLGNVYTAYKYMYSADGIRGIIIFQTLLAVFFGIYYTKIKNISDMNKIRCDVIFYSIVIYAIVLHPFSEFLFSTILSFNYVLFLATLSIIKFLVTKVKA